MLSSKTDPGYLQDLRWSFLWQYFTADSSELLLQNSILDTSSGQDPTVVKYDFSNYRNGLFAA